MDKEEQENKRFLEQQLQWCKEQDAILEEIEIKLYEMKEIAQNTRDHEFTDIEIDQLDSRFRKLQKEINYLEAQLHSVVH